MNLGDKMKKRRKIESRYYIIIILFVILFLLGLLMYFVNDRRHPSKIEQVLQDSILFIQKIVSSPIHFITGKFDENQEKNKKYRDYKTLEQNSEQLETILAKNKELESELEELKSLLELNQTLVESDFLNATVVTRNMDTWYQTLIIDKGQKNGVKPNMAVVTPKGIIGEVIHTSNFNSTVKLFTSVEEDHKISVKIETENGYVYGLLSQYDQSRGVYVIEGIAENKEIKEGMHVITTGLGNTFPAGILLGSVKKVTKDHFDLARTVFVEPSVDFDSIRYVTILKK